MRRTVTVGVPELGEVFFKVNDYLSRLPKETKVVDAPPSVQDRLDDACKLWQEHFNVKATADWETHTLKFTFKDKSAFMLFMLEWK